jgi:hypothetical protein
MTVKINSAVVYELDMLVAENVLCWVDEGTHYWVPDGYANWCKGAPFMCNKKDVPNFGTDIAAAWEVLKRLHTLGLSTSVSNKFDQESLCTVWKGNEILCEAKAETAPEAICLAALQAVELQ